MSAKLISEKEALRLCGVEFNGNTVTLPAPPPGQRWWLRSFAAQWGLAHGFEITMSLEPQPEDKS